MSTGRLVANYGKVVIYTRGGSVAEWSWRRTRNPVVLGSSPAMATCWLSELLALFSVVPSLNPRPRL